MFTHNGHWRHTTMPVRCRLIPAMYVSCLCDLQSYDSERNTRETRTHTEPEAIACVESFPSRLNLIPAIYPLGNPEDPHIVFSWRVSDKS